MIKPIDLEKPFPSSRKVYIAGTLHPEIRVPVREISLTENPPVYVYDTSGPYTDPHVSIDVKKGLKPIRTVWTKKRGDVEELAGQPSSFGQTKPLRAI